MSQDITLIIFSAGDERDDAERLVTHCRHAITADVVAQARQIDIIGRIIVATDSHALAKILQPYAVIINYDDPKQSFEFGARFEQILKQYAVQKPFYIGGGAAALLTLDEMRAIAELLREREQTVIPNNLFSSDFVAFAPGEAALGLPPMANDNNLAYALRTQRQHYIAHVGIAPRQHGNVCRTNAFIQPLPHLPRDALRFGFVGIDAGDGYGKGIERSLRRACAPFDFV